MFTPILFNAINNALTGTPDKDNIYNLYLYSYYDYDEENGSSEYKYEYFNNKEDAIEKLKPNDENQSIGLFKIEFVGSYLKHIEALTYNTESGDFENSNNQNIYFSSYHITSVEYPEE